MSDRITIEIEHGDAIETTHLSALMGVFRAFVHSNDSGRVWMSLYVHHTEGTQDVDVHEINGRTCISLKGGGLDSSVFIADSDVERLRDALTVRLDEIRAVEMVAQEEVTP